MHPPECPYEHLAASLAGDIWEYTSLVIDDPRLTTLAPYGTLADAQERGTDLR